MVEGYEGGKLRARTRSKAPAVEVFEPEPPLSGFEKFKLIAKNKIPGIEFHTEYDFDLVAGDDEITCELKGTSCTLEELEKIKDPNAQFIVEDGRIILLYKKQKVCEEKATPRPKPLYVMHYFGLLLLLLTLVVFISLNHEKYMKLARDQQIF
jgi:hypothetical protein